MKLSISLFTLLFTLHSFHVSGCENGSLDELGKVWINFRPLALAKKPANLQNFFKFPIQLLDMQYPNKAMKLINRGSFNKYYENIFVSNVPDELIFLHKELIKSTNAEYLAHSSSHFNTDGCSRMGSARILDYNFQWINGTWKIVSVYYDSTDLQFYSEMLKLDK